MITTYQELKTSHSNAINKIMTKHRVFWAFSNERLEEGKKLLNITDNKDIVSIGAGGFIPKLNINALTKDLKQENLKYIKTLKEIKEQKEKSILYELNNFEAFLTGEIDEVIKIFKGIYTIKEIKKVYLKNINNY
jgi:hypothetical protein